MSTVLLLAVKINIIKKREPEIKKGVIIFFWDCVMLYHAEYTFTQNRFPVPLCFLHSNAAFVSKSASSAALLCDLTSSSCKTLHALAVDHPSH